VSERDDRFQDLEPGARAPGPPRHLAGRGESAGERLEERDRTHPEPAGPPERPRARNKYAWAVGILFVMVLSVLLFVQTIPNTGESLFGPEPGTRIKAFAAPNALGNLEGDANVCQRAPCRDGTGERPACELRSEEVVNVCTLRRRPLVLTFMFDRGADCEPQVDRTERVRGSVPGVQFATVFFSRKEREEIRRVVEARNWTQPVAVDSDGAVANLYGVGGCPTTVFTRAGGKVADVELGNLTEEQLRTKAERLLG
jgi:peroxiredoxin